MPEQRSGADPTTRKHGERKGGAGGGRDLMSEQIKHLKFWPLIQGEV